MFLSKLLPNLRTVTWSKLRNQLLLVRDPFTSFVKNIIPIQMFTMLWLGIFDSQPKLDGHSLRFKRATKLTSIGTVNEALVYLVAVKITVLDIK